MYGAIGGTISKRNPGKHAKPKPPTHAQIEALRQQLKAKLISYDEYMAKVRGL